MELAEPQKLAEDLRQAFGDEFKLNAETIKFVLFKPECWNIIIYDDQSKSADGALYVAHCSKRVQLHMESSSINLDELEYVFAEIRGDQKTFYEEFLQRIKVQIPWLPVQVSSSKLE